MASLLGMKFKNRKAMQCVCVSAYEKNGTGWCWSIRNSIRDPLCALLCRWHSFRIPAIGCPVATAAPSGPVCRPVPSTMDTQIQKEINTRTSFVSHRCHPASRRLLPLRRICRKFSPTVDWLTTPSKGDGRVDTHTYPIEYHSEISHWCDS